MQEKPHSIKHNSFKKTMAGVTFHEVLVLAPNTPSPSLSGYQEISPAVIKRHSNAAEKIPISTAINSVLQQLFNGIIERVNKDTNTTEMATPCSGGGPNEVVWQQGAAP